MMVSEIQYNVLSDKEVNAKITFMTIENIGETLSQVGDIFNVYEKKGKGKDSRHLIYEQHV